MRDERTLPDDENSERVETETETETVKRETVETVEPAEGDTDGSDVHDQQDTVDRDRDDDTDS